MSLRWTRNKLVALGDEMNKGLLIINGLFLLIALFFIFLPFDFSSFNIFSLIIIVVYLLPFVIVLVSSIRYFKGKGESVAWAAGGVLPSTLALFGYYEAYVYDGTSGQIALVYVVFPVYQLIGIGIIGGIAALVIRKNELDKLID